MSGTGDRPAPAGVRPVTPNAEPAGPGTGASRLRWVLPGPFTLAHGDRVAVRENGTEWLGRVVVPPERLVEWPDLPDLPVVARRALRQEWPGAPITDGLRLLTSLALPPGVPVRSGPDSGSRPLIPGPATPPRETTEHEGRDQERGGEQRERA